MTDVLTMHHLQGSSPRASPSHITLMPRPKSGMSHGMTGHYVRRSIRSSTTVRQSRLRNASELSRGPNILFPRTEDPMGSKSPYLHNRNHCQIGVLTAVPLIGSRLGDLIPRTEHAVNPLQTTDFPKRCWSVV